VSSASLENNLYALGKVQFYLKLWSIQELYAIVLKICIKLLLINFFLSWFSLFPQTTTDHSYDSYNVFIELVDNIKKRHKDKLFLIVKSDQSIRDGILDDFSKNSIFESNIFYRLYYNYYLLSSLKEMNFSESKDIRKILDKKKYQIISASPVYINSLLTNTVCYNTKNNLPANNNLPLSLRIELDSDKKCYERNNSRLQITNLLLEHFGKLETSNEFLKKQFLKIENSNAYYNSELIENILNQYVKFNSYESNLDFRDYLFEQLLKKNRFINKKFSGLSYDLHQIEIDPIKNLIGYIDYQKLDSGIEVLFLIPGERLVLFAYFENGKFSDIELIIKDFLGIYLKDYVGDEYFEMAKESFPKTQFLGSFQNSTEKDYGLDYIYREINPILLYESKDNLVLIENSLENNLKKVAPLLYKSIELPYQKYSLDLSEDGDINYLYFSGLDFHIYHRRNTSKSFLVSNLKNFKVIYLIYGLFFIFHFSIRLFYSKLFYIQKTVTMFQLFLLLYSLISLFNLFLLDYLVNNNKESLDYLSFFLYVFNFFQIFNLINFLFLLYLFFRNIQLNCIKLSRVIKYLVFLFFCSVQIYYLYQLKVLFIFQNN
jgi:hypothetical protein